MGLHDSIPGIKGGHRCVLTSFDLLCVLLLLSPLSMGWNIMSFQASPSSSLSSGPNKSSFDIAREKLINLKNLRYSLVASVSPSTFVPPTSTTLNTVITPPTPTVADGSTEAIQADGGSGEDASKVPKQVAEKVPSQENKVDGQVGSNNELETDSPKWVNMNPTSNNVNGSTTTTSIAAELSLLKEALLHKILPNKKEELLNRLGDLGEKLVELKEKVEPENLDPRLHKRLQHFLKSIFPRLTNHPRLHLTTGKSKKSADGVESRSGSEEMDPHDGVRPRQDPDEDDFVVSDQEPDVSFKKRQKSIQKTHFYLSRNKQKNYGIPERSGYETAADEEEDDKNGGISGYGFNEDSPSVGGGDDDLYPFDSPARHYSYSPSSRSHKGKGKSSSRGHKVSHSTSRGDHGGGGHGGGGGGGNGGLTDPFTILGGLAFLTYLAMLIQQRMMTPAPAPPAGGGKREDISPSSLPLSQLDLEGLLQKAIPHLLSKMHVTGGNTSRSKSRRVSSPLSRVDNSSGSAENNAKKASTT